MEPFPKSWRTSPGGRLFLAIAREETGLSLGDGEAPEKAWQLAEFHGMAPLVAGYILGHPGAGWPAAIRDEAKKTQDFALFRNIQLLALLGEIQQALEGAGIPWISLKGPVFTEQYTGGLRLRASSDLDVLVRPGDAEKADRVFRSLQITSAHPVRPCASWLGVRKHEHPYQSKSPRYLVELHWNLTGGCYDVVDLETAFSRSRRTRLESGIFPVLSREDALLFAAMHAFGHRWDRLYHVKMMDWLLRGEPGTPAGAGVEGLDWNYVLAAAAQADKTRILLLGLALVHDYMDVALPARIIDLIRADPVLPRLQEQVDENFCGTGPASSSRRTFLFKWRALETARDRTALIPRALVTRLIWRQA
ncbi:MAG TPA: hypothetical protein DCM68_07250 [Verrucomicrobia bacterium]|nr:hypothetical protein [Verrucomicrobiota bacterium]